MCPGSTPPGLRMRCRWGAIAPGASPAKGQQYPAGQFPNAFVRIVSDGYIGAMGIPLRAGRDFTERDAPSSEHVIVINETMARACGRARMRSGQDHAGAERRVVGVVGDVRHLALEQGSGIEMYLPIRQSGDFASVDLVVRTALPPADFAAAVRAALRPIAPNLPGNEFRALQQLVDKAVSPRRFVVLLLGGFAAFALILASLGIYAVISYSVSQRTQEIGIRMALGASARDLQGRIIWQTLALAAAGMILGGAASWLLSRAFTGMLYGVTASDPPLFSACWRSCQWSPRLPAIFRRAAPRASIPCLHCGPIDLLTHSARHVKINSLT